MGGARCEDRLSCPFRVAVKEGREEGLQLGEKVGEEKGKKEKAVEMAKVMKKDGEPIELYLLITY